MEPHKPFTIIIADDDDDDRELFFEVFSNDRHFTVTGSLGSGMEVLDEINQKKNIPDVLLVDMYMPHFSGADLVKEIENRHTAPAMYKFVISTTSNIAENEPQLNSPYIVFLKKPVSLNEINALPDLIYGYLQQRLSHVS